MPLFFEGRIAGLRKSEWLKPGERYPTKLTRLQFSEKLDDEALKFIEISLPDGDDGSAHRVGQEVKLQVRATAKDKTIYLRVENPAPRSDGPAPGSAPVQPRAAAKV